MEKTTTTAKQRRDDIHAFISRVPDVTLHPLMHAAVDPLLDALDRVENEDILQRIPKKWLPLDDDYHRVLRVSPPSEQVGNYFELSIEYGWPWACTLQFTGPYMEMRCLECLKSGKDHHAFGLTLGEIASVMLGRLTPRFTHTICRGNCRFALPFVKHE